MKLFVQKIVLGVSIALSPFALAADGSNAASAFSHTQNPNGRWSYGWWHEGVFHLSTKNSEVSPGVFFWQGGEFLLGEPTVGKNEGTEDYVINGSTVYEPGDLALHPGPNGERAVLRWTSRTGGFYFITANFIGADPLTTTDVEIATGNLLLLGGDVTGNINPLMYAGLIHVRPGQTIDFSVGYGSNSAYEFDTTIVDLTIAKAAPGQATRVPAAEKTPKITAEKNRPGK